MTDDQVWDIMTNSWMTRDEWHAQNNAASKPKQHCSCCELPLSQSDDGTLFVDGTDTSADGLSYCPPDPDWGGDFRDHKIEV